jgi:hypothetical protein
MLKSKIENQFALHDLTRICQGDILRDIKFSSIIDSTTVSKYLFQYSIVVSQDCDLEQYQNKKNEIQDGGIFNQYIPNILLVPSFPAETLRNGDHLDSLYNYKQERINSDKWKVLRGNNNERYHFLTGNVDMQIPDLVCDFKIFFTVNFEIVLNQYSDSYLGTLNELFRENFSQRFTNYLSRIGLPVV